MHAASDGSQLLIDHESAAGPTVLQVRGSLIVSSLQTLRDLGHFSRYEQNLPAALHDDVLYALAASWLPLEVAMAHYGACDAMNLQDSELDSIGQAVSGRIMGTFLGTILRGSRQVGAQAAPLVALRHYDKLWDRLLVGGTCHVRQTGPKDAVIASKGLGMFRYRYFRVAYASLIRGAGLMFAKIFYTRVQRTSDTSMVVGISWV
ncbi:MAG: hypothetical protein RL701_2531 [Pseudomonadota bacterium]